MRFVKKCCEAVVIFKRRCVQNYRVNGLIYIYIYILKTIEESRIANVGNIRVPVYILHLILNRVLEPI
jgi:hypothetical protein